MIEFKEMRKEWRQKKKAEEAARKRAHEDDSGADGFDGEEDMGDTSASSALPSAPLTGESPSNDFYPENVFQYSAPPYPQYHPLHQHAHYVPSANGHMEQNIEAMRPQTAPGGMDMFSFSPSRSPHSRSPQSPVHIAKHPTSPFKSYPQDPPLHPEEIGALGLPKRRSSIPMSSALDGIPEMGAAHFQYQPPPQRLSFSTGHQDWYSGNNTPIFHSARRPSSQPHPHPQPQAAGVQ